MTKEHSWPGAFAAYGAAFKQIQKNPKPALFYLGIYAALSLVSLAMQGQTSYADKGHMPYEDIVAFVFWLALPVYGLAVADKRSIDIAAFMKFDLKKYLTLIAVAILSVLIMGVSLLLLIVPAIWAIAWLSMGSYAVVDKNLGPLQALKESKRLTRGHVGKVWGLIGASILLGLPVAALVYVPYIGNIAAQAFTVLTYGVLAVLYRWLQQQPQKD